MILTIEEQNLLDGHQGRMMQKLMQSLVRYAQIIGAEQLADITWNGHFSGSFPLPGVGLRFEMLDEWISAGLTTKYPFTMDPRSPIDFENYDFNKEQLEDFRILAGEQALYDQKMYKLGIKDENAFTCTPYLEEVGNIPKKGAIIAWSESSAVVYANSVLGARTHRNAAIMDFISNMVGKTPYAGLVTDEGRKAHLLIELKTTRLPHPQLFGAMIGKMASEDVPFITGLDRHLGDALTAKVRDYLKEMGAACASVGGAVGLYHAENLTPEAVDWGRKLLKNGYKTFEIHDADLDELLASYPILWDDPSANPTRCLIGCPHLSMEELYWWTDHIHSGLQKYKRQKLAVDTVICAAPQVISKFQEDEESWQQLRSSGVKLSPACSEATMDNKKFAKEFVVTNSNKLRAFTTARFLPDEELLETIISGNMPR